MKKSNLNFVIFIAILLCCFILFKLNIVQLVIEHNAAIQIVFFTIMFSAGIYGIYVYIKRFIDKNKFKETIMKMEITEEFNQIYKELKDKLEQEFKTMKKKLIITGIVLFVSATFFVTQSFVFKNPFGSNENLPEKSGMPILVIAGAGIISAVCVFLIIKDIKKYTNTYKYGIIGNLVNKIDKNLSYEYRNPELQRVLKGQYKKSEFEIDRIDTFLAEDFITGHLDATIPVVISDVYVQRDGNDEKGEVAIKLFSGLFATTAIRKNINTTIKILLDEKKLIKDDFIQMDSSDMEEFFDVYSTDQVMVMRIFTAEMMEILNDFYKKHQIRFEIILSDSRVHFRFHTNDMFETKIIQDPLNKNKLFLYYITLKLVLDITRKVNTNIDELEI